MRYAAVANRGPRIHEYVPLQQCILCELIVLIIYSVLTCERIPPPPPHTHTLKLDDIGSPIIWADIVQLLAVGLMRPYHTPSPLILSPLPYRKTQIS